MPKPYRKNFNRHRDKPYHRPFYGTKKRGGVARQSFASDENLLFTRLCHPETLLEAWKELRKGRTLNARRFAGAADRVSFELFERNLARNLTELRYRLISGRYRPDPVVNFPIPKANGGQRILTVLTIKDRVAQRAALSLIAPLFEPEFLPSSYGFRPDRSVQDALAQVEKYYAAGFRWAVDADIEAFFDNIDRTRLHRLLAEKISEQPLLALLRLWLWNNQGINRKPQVILPPPPMEQELAGQSPLPVKSEPPSMSKRLTHFTRLAVEGGLDWGISNLTDPNTDHYSSYGYAAYRPSYRSPYNLEEDDTEEQNWQVAPLEPRENNLSKEAIKRLGADGALLALAVARGLARKGLKQGALGGVAKAGAGLGTAATLGMLAHRAWKHSQQQRLQKTEEEGTEPAYFVPPHRRGIAQGSILSPLYSNLYLHEFDRKLSEKGYRLVRFADDLLILCGSNKEAEQGLAFAERTLGSLGLNFKADKTGIRLLEKGFKFLGAEMGANGCWRKDEEAMPHQVPVRQWVKQARVGWLKHTSRLRPGVVQKGRDWKDENGKITDLKNEE